MLVIRVRECSTRHQVLNEVLGYHASTDRKLLMDAECTNRGRNENKAEQLHKVKLDKSTSEAPTLVEWDGGHSAGIEQENI